jgi:hypothetical protein
VYDEEDKQEISYIKIMFAVCGGVLMAGAIGSVISLLVMTALIDTAAESFNDQDSRITEQMQDRSARISIQTAESQKTKRAATEQQRLKSATGQTLSRECREYSQFYRDNPSSYAKQERDKACGKYRTYMTTGKTSK